MFFLNFYFIIKSPLEQFPIFPIDILHLETFQFFVFDFFFIFIIYFMYKKSVIPLLYFYLTRYSILYHIYSFIDFICIRHNNIILKKDRRFKYLVQYWIFHLIYKDWKEINLWPEDLRLLDDDLVEYILRYEEFRNIGWITVKVLNYARIHKVNWIEETICIEDWIKAEWIKWPLQVRLPMWHSHILYEFGRHRPYFKSAYLRTFGFTWKFYGRVWQYFNFDFD